MAYIKYLLNWYKYNGFKTSQDTWVSGIHFKCKEKEADFDCFTEFERSPGTYYLLGPIQFYHDHYEILRWKKVAQRKRKATQAESYISDHNRRVRAIAAHVKQSNSYKGI